MSRDYQKSRNPYGTFDQENELWPAGERHEYRDLYNPNKSIWNEALKSKSVIQAHRGAPGYSSQDVSNKMTWQDEAHQTQSHRGGTSRVGQQSSGAHYRLPQSEEEVFGSRYNETRRNTYGCRTTGYGPRD